MLWTVKSQSYWYFKIYRQRFSDTVDHTLLMTRLSTRFGIQGTVLKWLKSYLSSSKLFVKVGNSHSSQRSLKCGVRQGSVLGPLLYLLYISPIADIINDHGLSYHLYADNIQLYITFKSTSLNDIQQVKLRVECRAEIRESNSGPLAPWPRTNRLCHPRSSKFLLTIIPRARMGSESIAHEAEGRMGY